MEKTFKYLDHYQDPGEYAISRDLATYKAMVFQDEGEGWLKTRPADMIPEKPMQWSMRHYHTLAHFTPEQTEEGIRSRKDPTIAFEWDWKEGKMFGGLDHFFAEHSRILDLGSGKGLAVHEINEQLQERDITCIGIDDRYFNEKPRDKNLIAGDFAQLPFEDESFNRMLSVESFPCWLPKEEKTIDTYIEEMTRISQVGTIWRGTLPKYYEDDIISFSTETIVRKIVENGWEVLVNGDAFAAKLVGMKK